MKTDVTNLTPAVFDAANIVYVRRLAEDEVERLVAPEARNMLDSTGDLFAVLSSEGQPLAILEGREAAFALARANSLTPVSVH